jgi:hypothetical protein
MTTRFNIQRHKIGAVKIPVSPIKDGDVTVLRLSAVDIDLPDIGSKAIEELKQQATTAKKISANQLQYAQERFKIEQVIKETTRNLELIENETRYRKGRVRRNLLWLEERLSKYPEEFQKDDLPAPKSFSELIETRINYKYSSVDAEFRAARVERDLGVALGTFSYYTLKPLFFANVYKSKSGASSSKDSSGFKKLYGTYKNEQAFQLQLKAFLLACELAGVSAIPSQGWRKDAKKYKPTEFSKIEPSHIQLAVKTIKAELNITGEKKPRVKEFTIKEQELDARCTQLEMQLAEWKEFALMLLTNLNHT